MKSVHLKLVLSIYVKRRAGIGALRRIKPFVPLGTLVTLYRSLIEPYFDYCSPLWDTCGKQLKDILQKNSKSSRKGYYRLFI